MPVKERFRLWQKNKQQLFKTRNNFHSKAFVTDIAEKLAPTEKQWQGYVKDRSHDYIPESIMHAFEVHKETLRGQDCLRKSKSKFRLFRSTSPIEDRVTLPILVNDGMGKGGGARKDECRHRCRSSHQNTPPEGAQPRSLRTLEKRRKDSRQGSVGQEDDPYFTCKALEEGQPFLVRNRY